jgi:hypothetical protein
MTYCNTCIDCAPKTAKIESRPQARHWRSNNTVADLAVSKVPQDAQYQLSCVTEIDISLISALLTLQFAALN